MKTLSFGTSVVLLFIVLFVCSCGSDDPEIPKSTAKSMTSFKFESLTPTVSGNISESDKKISVTVPFGTNVTALSPTIEISEKAAVSPASGVAQNFTNAVTYTVTAEDNSSQIYTVTVALADPPASSEKDILSFKFLEFTPEVVGTITGTDIALMVPNGTDITNIVPSIEISDEATITPAGSLAQNFSNPVVYVVTAEDGSTKEYHVSVTIDPTVDFVLDPYDGETIIQQDDTLTIEGSNFGDYHQNSVVLVSSTDENSRFTLDVGSSSDDNTLVVKIPADFPTGDYKIEVHIGSQSTTMEELFTIKFHVPVITSVDESPVVRGENITINGNYFPFNINVELQSDEFSPVPLEIVSQEDNSITVTIPDDTAPGDYTIAVTANDESATYGPITVVVPAGIPYIASVDDSSVARGQTLTLHGQYLHKDGVITNINFIPWPDGGTTIVRSASSNSEGTQVTFTVPNDFPIGTYTIAVDVDFEFSEEFGDVIQITN